MHAGEDHKEDFWSLICHMIFRCSGSRLDEVIAVVVLANVIITDTPQVLNTCQATLPDGLVIGSMMVGRF